MNGYMELSNMSNMMTADHKKTDFASRFVRTTSIACTTEPQVTLNSYVFIET